MKYLRKTLLIIAYIFLGYNIIGLFIIPPVTRSIMEKQIKSQLGRTAEIEIFMFNPYTLSTTIKGFHIKEQDGITDFVTINDLYLNIESISALKFAPVVKEVRVEGPFIRAVRYTEESFSFSDILTLLTQDTTESHNTQEEETSTAEMFKFEVQNISITGGGAEIVDQHMNKTHSLKDLNITIPLLSNITDINTSAEIDLNALFNDSKVLLKCDSKPFSKTVDSTVELSVKGIDLPFYYDYVPMDYDIKLVGGKMDMETNLTFKLSDKNEPDVSVSGNMSLEGLSVIDGLENPIADMKSFRLNIAPSEVMKGTIHLKKIEMDSSKIEITRNKNGDINLYSMFLMPATETSGAGTATTESEAMALNNIVVDIIDIKDSSVYFSDNYKLADGNTPAKSELLKMPSISIKETFVDMAKSEVKVSNIDLKNGSTTIQRLPSGELIIEPLSDFGTIEETSQKTAQSDIVWNVVIANLNVEDFSMYGNNLALESDDKIVVDEINLKAANLSTMQDEKSKINFSCKLNKTASISYEGECSIFPVTADMQIKLENMNLAWAQPFFLNNSGIIISNGLFSTTGGVQAELNSDMTEVKAVFKGSVSMDKFKCVDEEHGTDLVSWERFNIEGLEAGAEPMYANIAQITFDGLNSHATLNPDWTINFLNIIDKAMNSFGYSMTKTDETSSVTQKATDAEGTTETFPIEVGKVGKAAQKIIESEVATGMLSVNIDKFEMKKGSVVFTDKSIEPNYVANVDDINCTVSNLSTDVTTMADITVDAKFGGYSTVHITGVTNPFREEMLVDVNVQLNNMDMSPLGGYTGKHIGYEIEKGDLTLDLDYNIKGNLLDSINDFAIDQFTLGNKVESKDAINAPFKLAISMLKDRKGMININTPVNGRIDDPEFKVAKIVMKTILNLVVKAATKPFSFIASMFGKDGYSGDDINHIEYNPGSLQLAKTSKSKLETLEKALFERPGINLKVTGYADIKNDRLEMIAEKLDKLVTIKEHTTSDNGQGLIFNSRQNSVKGAPIDRKKYINMALKASETGSYKFLDNMYKENPSVIESEKAVLENIKVPESELKAMAQERAKFVKNFLLRNKEIAAERIQLKEATSLMPEKVKGVEDSRVVLDVNE